MLGQLPRDADTSASRPKEQYAVVFGIYTAIRLRHANRVHKAGKDDCAGALDVVVEAQVAAAVRVEEIKGVLGRKVLKLNEHLGEGSMERAKHRVHDFHKLNMRVRHGH